MKKFSVVLIGAVLALAGCANAEQEDTDTERINACRQALESADTVFVLTQEFSIQMQAGNLYNADLILRDVADLRDNYEVKKRECLGN